MLSVDSLNMNYYIIFLTANYQDLYSNWKTAITGTIKIFMQTVHYKIANIMLTV